MRLITTLAAAAACLAVLPAAAATITVTAGTRGGTESFYGAVGQSFLAPGSQLQTIGLQFVTLNPSNTPGTVTVSLLQGAGFGGAVLGSHSYVPTNLTPNTGATITGVPFTSFDFGGITLTAGAAYTLTVSATSAYDGVVFGPNLINPPYGTTFTADAYADGQLYSGTYFGSQLGGCGGNPASCDLNFQVVTADATAAVPEPATWATMVGGFGLAGLAMRRGRSRRMMQAI